MGPPGYELSLCDIFPPLKYIPSSEYYVLYKPVNIMLLFQIKQQQLQISEINTTLLQRTFISKEIHVLNNDENRRVVFQ